MRQICPRCTDDRRHMENMGKCTICEGTGWSGHYHGCQSCYTTIAPNERSDGLCKVCAGTGFIEVE